MPLFAAADAFLLTARDFFTSGSLMLAMTYGLPVIAAPGGHVSEFLDRSFLEPWEPATTERLTSIMDGLDDWLGRVRPEELAEIRSAFDARRVSGSLARRLRSVAAGASLRAGEP